jgi:hypothetical protein
LHILIKKLILDSCPLVTREFITICQKAYHKEEILSNWGQKEIEFTTKNLTNIIRSSSQPRTAIVFDMLLGVGLLDGSRVWSYERMLMGREIFSIVEKMMGERSG